MGQGFRKKPVCPIDKTNTDNSGKAGQTITKIVYAVGINADAV